MSNPTELPDLDRAEFEAAWRAKYDMPSNVQFAVFRDGRYQAPAIQDFYEGWQMARRAQPEGEAPQAELVELLKAIRPNYGDVGPRDIDVTAQRKRIDRAIELLSAPAATLPPLCGAQHAESGKEDGPLSAKMHDVVVDLREYAGSPGYSHGDYADTMRQAASTIEALRAQLYHWGPRAAQLDGGQEGSGS